MQVYSITKYFILTDFPLEVAWGNTVFEVFSVIMALWNNLVNSKLQTGT